MPDRPDTEPGDVRCPWHDTHVENFGKNGKNGRLGTVIGEVKGLKIDMKLVKAEQTKMHIKLAVITSGGSIVGGGLVALLMKALG